MKKLALSLVVTCLALLGLTACVDATRDPNVAMTQGIPGIYAAEFASNQQHYDFGEPVQLRAILTNESTSTLTFGSEAGAASAIEISVKAWPYNVGAEQRLWSQENRDQVKSVIVLAPQQSYIITWTLSLSSRSQYILDMLWTDPSAYPPNSDLMPGTKSRTGMGIFYGIQPPGPMP